MDFQIIIQIILIGIGLSMDAFAVSITDGLIYSDINKRKSFFIAGTFGFMQAFMPLVGYWLVELVSTIVGAAGGESAGNIMATIVTYVAFALLLLIGAKMIIDSIKEMKKPLEEKEMKKFSVKEVIFYGFATAIDALGTGVALHGGTLSNNVTIWLHVCIIMVCTFIISLIGLFLGHIFEKLFKGRYEITGIIGGIILIYLSVWILLSNLLG